MLITQNSKEPYKQSESTWDRLESALNIDDSFNRSERNTRLLHPVRKISANPSRTCRRHEIRSISVSKGSSFTTDKRPSSSVSYTRSSLSLTHINGLSLVQLQQIYAAKCYDLEIPVLQDQEKRFISYCAGNLKDRNFCLKESGLGYASAQKIGEILKNNHNFAFVNLSRNSFKDQGAAKLVKSLKNSVNIVHLDISSNEISAEGSERVLLDLVEHPSLASLDISSHEGLHRNRLGLQGAKAISKLLRTNSCLGFLNLSGTALGPEGLEALLEGLRLNKSLVSLDLSNNSLGARYIEALSKTLVETDVRNLNLAQNKIGNEGCEHISLMISGGYDGYCAIMKLNLAENDINTNGISKIFAALRINNHVKEVNLEKNRFSKGLSQNLLQFLTENVALEELNLSNCELNFEGLMGFSEGISKNNGIKRLFLNNNSLQDRGCEIISFGLAKNKVLKVLDLSSNKIRDKGGMALAKALQINSQLETIHLKDNSLKDPCGQLLSEITRFKHNILKLSLDLNPLNLKFVHEIKNNLSNNYDHQQKEIVPNLQKVINRFNFNGTTLDDLYFKIATKKKEISDAEGRLKHQGSKLENAKETEEQKLKELQDEYHCVREASMKLSEEIDSLQSQMNVMNIQKVRVIREKEIAEISERIGHCVNLAKNGEKKSKG